MTDKAQPTEPEIFVLADHARNELIAEIKVDQWGWRYQTEFRCWAGCWG
jgi:hypothetical protein